jgi:hypothetical protein
VWRGTTNSLVHTVLLLLNIHGLDYPTTFKWTAEKAASPACAP